MAERLVVARRAQSPSTDGHPITRMRADVPSGVESKRLDVFVLVGAALTLSATREN
jgi:hypothetical protein